VKGYHAIPKWLPALLLGLFLVSTTAGCSSGVHATTWTDLVVHEGVVYAADLTQVRALDAQTGQPIWNYPAEGSAGPFYTVTLLPGERLFVTSQERSGGLFTARTRPVIRALSLEGLETGWPQPFTGAQGDFVASGVVADDILVIGNGDGNVYALDVTNGSSAWPQPFHTQGRVWASPLILSDTVYIASLDHNLYALDLQTGAERWRFTTSGAVASRPLALNGTLYFGAFDYRLYAVDLTTHETRWTFQGENWFWGTPATDGDTIYAADVDGNIYALDSETGLLRWTQKVEQIVRLGPQLSSDGQVLLIGGNGGAIYALSAADGTPLWSRAGGGQIAAMVVAGDIVYVSRILANEHVQAFYTINGRELWTYPQPQAQ